MVITDWKALRAERRSAEDLKPGIELLTTRLLASTNAQNFNTTQLYLIHKYFLKVDNLVTNFNSRVKQSKAHLIDFSC